MDAYAIGGVLGRTPYAVSAGIDSKSSRLAKIPLAVGCKSLVSGFIDEGHLGYYSVGGRRIRCGVEPQTLRRDDKVKDKTKKKVLKKRSKLLKNLSRDLSTLTQIGFGFDCSDPCDLLDQDQEKAISEAAEALLTQLQKLRAEEKKCKGKEEKYQASQMQMALECEDSSSSSSESSDSECEGSINMNKMKREAITQRVESLPKPVVENSPPILSSVMIQGNVIDIQPAIPDSQPMIRDSINSLVKSTEVGCVGESRFTKDETTSVASTAPAQKIEVCLGGKCKKSGAQAIMEELQRVVGIEGAVSGCKCMGKCRVGPNVRLSSSADGLSDNAINTPATNSLCLGVGLEDVSLIASSFLRGNGGELGLAAS